VLGQTADDAVGEAFDKVAKLLGLPYPGGPSIAKAAVKGNPEAIKLPKAKLDNRYDFSFSGLKTAVLRATQELCGKKYDFPSIQLANLLNEQQKADIAASFQMVAIETLVRGVKTAAEGYGPTSIVIAGGVAANQELRKQLSRALPQQIEYTDIKLCTDNAAMVACLGYFMAKNNQPQVDPYTLEINPGLRM
jgi:N6-L-threonylcarbamoyladenine synthase